MNEILDNSFAQVDLGIKNKTDKESKQKAKNFILDRIKNYYVENGFSVNILNSVLKTDKEININTKKPEFLAWKWIDVDMITEVVVDFKLEVYKSLQKKLKQLLIN